MQPATYIIGQLNRLRITENLNRFLGLIDDQLAVAAIFQVALEFLLQVRIELVVDVIR